MIQAVLVAPDSHPETVDDPYSPLFRFTVDQFQQMIEQGIVKDGAPVELLDGVIFNKNRADAGENPIVHGSQHARCLRKLIPVLTRLAEQLGLELLCQLPIQLSATSSPEPDFALVKPLSSDAASGHPQPDEVPLTTEVASSSLNYDRENKQRVFAAAGIPQYWIINLIAKQLEVFQVLDIQQGRYQQPKVLTITDRVEVIGRDGKSIALPVADLF